MWAAPDDADIYDVSMKSGLEGRNNGSVSPTTIKQAYDWYKEYVDVSMKSGLEGRNNTSGLELSC